MSLNNDQTPDDIEAVTMAYNDAADQRDELKAKVAELEAALKMAEAERDEYRRMYEESGKREDTARKTATMWMDIAEQRMIEISKLWKEINAYRAKKLE